MIYIFKIYLIYSELTIQYYTIFYIVVININKIRMHKKLKVAVVLLSILIIGNSQGSVDYGESDSSSSNSS